MSNSEHHQVIIIPGLGDRTAFISRATQHWRKRGFEPEVIPVGWRDGSSDFNDKLSFLIDMVRNKARSGPVYIVGTSAGGSMAGNLLCELPDEVERVAMICARLKTGFDGRRSLENMSATSPAFRQSVTTFEKRVARLPQEQLRRMMTVSALFGDEYVPANTSVIPGAYNTRIPTVSHMFSIGAALVLSGPVLKFLRFGFR